MLSVDNGTILSLIRHHFLFCLPRKKEFSKKKVHKKVEDLIRNNGDQVEEMEGKHRPRDRNSSYDI